MSDSSSSTCVRVYVGGLPADVKLQELRDRFDRFVSSAADCKVQDVELPRPKTGDKSQNARGWAYLTLQGADAMQQSQKLQQTYHRTKWKGSVLRVETAKPHFKLKLEQEWAEMKQKREEEREKRERQVDTVEPMKVAVKFKGRKTRFSEVEDVQVQVQVLEEQEQEQVETDFESQDEQQENEEALESQEEQQESEESEEEALGEDDVEAFVRQMEAEAQAEEMQSEKPKLTPEEVNAKRLAALEAKQQRKKQEQVVIPKIGDSVGNKKITFDDSGNEQELEEQEEAAKVVSNWMDSSDDEDEADSGARKTFDFTDGDDVEAADAEAQKAFALRPEFTGESGKKLFEMQKRFGGDSRFRLDARFLEAEANEFGGNDVGDEGEIGDHDDETVVELQNFLDEENSDEAARQAREMQEEEAAALRIVSTMFPEVDVTRLQRRMQDQRAPKDPLKEAAWMGELKRYDPRDTHSCREFEIPMVSTSSGVNKDGDVSAGLPKREEKEIPTGGDRFFSTSGKLGNMFSRVRKNSEDGEEGEAALDGVFKFGAVASETDKDVGAFKLSSLFSFPVGEDKPLAAMGEQLLEDEQDQQNTSAGDWRFSTDAPEDEAMATDSEDGEDAEMEDAQDNDSSAVPKKRAKKSLEDFLAFGRTFVGGEAVTDWPERRKKLTVDYKRKRRDAIKMKKRQNKQQHKANKASADSRKKARL